MESNQRALTAKRLSFKKRKASILKKIMEVSVLCDIEACAVILDVNGDIQTWPENKDAVLKIIDRHKDYLRANKKKKMIKNGVEKNQLDTRQLELDANLFDGLSTESVEGSLEDVCEGDQNQNRVSDLHSWEEGLFDGLPIESLQQVLRQLDSKLEAIAQRIEVLKMVNDQNQNNNNTGKEIVVFDEAKMQSIQEPSCFSDTMYPFGGEPNQLIIQDSNLSWFSSGPSFFSNNNILGSFGVDLVENHNQGFGETSEMGFFNMLGGAQTSQTPWFFAEESDHGLLNMVPGIYQLQQFNPWGLGFFQELEFPEQSNFGFWQN